LKGREDRPGIRYYLQDTTMASSPVAKPRPTEDEALAAFESIPLFMKSLPEDDIENPAISALQSLIYEGTPDGRVRYISNSSPLTSNRDRT
jgi:hypothetical protein